MKKRFILFIIIIVILSSIGFVYKKMQTGLDGPRGMTTIVQASKGDSNDIFSTMGDGTILGDNYFRIFNLKLSIKSGHYQTRSDGSSSSADPFIATNFSGSIEIVIRDDNQNEIYKKTLNSAKDVNINIFLRKGVKCSLAIITKDDFQGTIDYNSTVYEII